MELNFVYALIDPRLVGAFTVDPRFIDPAAVL